MVLQDKHISYLIRVSEGKVKLLWSDDRISSKYVYDDWANGWVEIDQMVANQMQVIGATHIVSKDGIQFVSLTKSGESLLLDEDEAWA